MWDAFAKALGVEEGQGSDTADFVISESHSEEKVYLGSFLPLFWKHLSQTLTKCPTCAHALTQSKGIHDAKIPYPAPIAITRELFDINAD